MANTNIIRNFNFTFLYFKKRFQTFSLSALRVQKAKTSVPTGDDMFVSLVYTVWFWLGSAV